MPLTLTPTDETPAVGLYAQESDLDDLRGSDNITSWSDISNNGRRSHARIQRAFARTDAMIEKLLSRIYSFPLNQATLTATDKTVLNVWSSVLTAYILYRNRGIPNSATTGRVMNPYKEEMQEILDDIWWYQNRKRSLGSAQISFSRPAFTGSNIDTRNLLLQDGYWGLDD